VLSCAAVGRFIGLRLNVRDIQLLS
jgi:hypothetical protein